MRKSIVVTCGFLALVLTACGSGDGGGQDTETDGEGDTPDTTGDVSVEDSAGDDATDGTECTSDGDCDDSDPCTEDACDEDFGTCSHDPVDADGDGYPAVEVGGAACAGGTDCDDGDEDIYPGAMPDCTGTVDMNCTGIDDRDEDEDGSMTVVCTGGDDCDDMDPEAFPGSLALECDLDRDCNGEEDADNDGDGYDSVDCGGEDCDDERPYVSPGESEVNCNGLDDDCNGELSTMEDADQDGFANMGCVAAGAEVDCDDADDTIYPDAPTTCDTVDDDCSGSWQDESGSDDDGDGYLDIGCSGGDDCDDADGTNHPGADNDSDGYTDDRCGGDDCDDFDGAYNPGIAASCTTEDYDCNGNPDEDDDWDGTPAVACGGTDCRDEDPSTLLGECSGVNECCDGCWQRNGCWKDPTTDWLWEDPPAGGYSNWDSAVSYCTGLSLAGRAAGEWHLPTISELRTFVRGCPATEDGGACGITDACLNIITCHAPVCLGCFTWGGPGAGSYWDPAVEGTPGSFWSSSPEEGDPSDAWRIDFDDALVQPGDKSNARYARCVSTGP